MKPQFKLGTDHKYYVSTEHITNGHWLLTREASKQLRALKKYAEIPNGVYWQRLDLDWLTESPMRELVSLIPKRDGYKPMTSKQAARVIFASDTNEIATYVFDCEDFEIGLSPTYVPLLAIGRPYVKDASSPILLLNDELETIGVIMPMRLK